MGFMVCDEDFAENSTAENRHALNLLNSNACKTSIESSNDSSPTIESSIL